MFNSRGNKDEITRKFNDTKEAFDKIKREVKQLEHFLKVNTRLWLIFFCYIIILLTLGKLVATIVIFL